MKTLYEYNQLTLDEKAQYLWDNGEFILNRKTEEGAFNLYTLSDFFVEVFLDKKSGQVTKFQSFKSLRMLEPYLNSISIEKLLR